MKRAYRQWIRVGLIVATTFLIISLTNPRNWAALPRVAETDRTSSSPTITNLAVATTTGDVFGYTAAFDEELKQIGQISSQDFAQRYASNAQYLPRINWDPTTAKFWDKFNLAPEGSNDSAIGSTVGFRLNSEELTVFKQNGFVVSERLSGPSFASLFYSIYSGDLPVFVSSDALLHAWHRSYDAMLEELEENYLARSLDEILKRKFPRDAGNFRLKPLPDRTFQH